MEYGCHHHAADSVQDELFRYEGAEKTLEVHFGGSGKTLRALPRSVWDEILDHACSRILSKTSGVSLDAYVLSESSLFVYDWRLYLKTCGKTTLLKCLPPLLEAVEKHLGASADWLRFSHKNFAFPEDQRFPHTSFEQETKFCLDWCASTSLTSAHVLGDLLSDHWNVLYVDLRSSNISFRSSTPLSIASVSTDSIITRPATARSDMSMDAFVVSDDIGIHENIVNVMMYGMERGVADHFYPRPTEKPDVAAMRATLESGIQSLFAEEKDAVFDPYMFSPCGYSLNALIRGEFYATIHVTPEENFSYASFETNLPTSLYDELLQRVLNVFKPQRGTIALFSDSKHQECLSLKNNDGRKAMYERMSHGSARIHDVFFAEMSSFSRLPSTYSCE